MLHLQLAAGAGQGAQLVLGFIEGLRKAHCEVRAANAVLHEVAEREEGVSGAVELQHLVADHNPQFLAISAITVSNLSTAYSNNDKNELQNNTYNENN